MRFEIRVRSHGSLWEVRAGAYGKAHFHPTQASALAQARLAARLAWEDRRVASSVSVLLADDVWQLDTIHGDAPYAPRNRLADFGEA